MNHYDLMIEYLKQKVELKDWHAVWDAAIDLKVIEAGEGFNGSKSDKPVAEHGQAEVHGVGKAVREPSIPSPAYLGDTERKRGPKPVLNGI